MPILDQLTTEEFEKLRTFIYARTGIHLADEKVALLSNRLRKRVRALGLSTFADYYERLAGGDDEEMTHFLSAVTTNETYFFRNDRLWEFLENELVPELLAEKRKKNQKDLRFWSAASSTGAEAYSLAILLREKVPAISEWDISIIASDISEKVLALARAGNYDNYALSKLTPARRKKFFRTSEDGKTFELRDEVRQMVRYQFHNLRDPFPTVKFDVILLRNVMMYFDLPMKRRVLKNVTAALKPKGYLIVGDVDPIRDGSGLRDDCELDYVRPAIYRKPG